MDGESCYDGTADGIGISTDSKRTSAKGRYCKGAGYRSSSGFNEAERSYLEMLDDGGIFVGDKWFAKTSTAAERAEYRAKFEHRIERNRRRRERRKAAATDRKERPPRRKIPNDPESQRRHRMPLERRKCIRRSTLAECPTPSEIRTAWHFHNASREALLRLGGLLLDLECFVDNSLVTVFYNGAFKIVGRKGGLREWIRENCPELEANYKSLQRIKGIAKRLRQAVDVMDPIPVSMLLDESASVTDAEFVHVQPRNGEPQPVRDRFVWEKSPIVFDADGRQYFHNENYWLVNRFYFCMSSEGFNRKRDLFRQGIILNGKEKCTIENYSWSDDRDVEKGCEKSEERVGNDFELGFFEEIGEMLKDIVRDPEWRKEMVMLPLRDIRDGLKAIGMDLLPRKTAARMRRGERTSVGRFILDAMDGYLNFYSQFLVYRWGRGYSEDWG